MDGNYSINLSENAKQLKFSYVGYKEQVLAIAGQRTLNVTMHEDNEVLDEVVVVGYGSMKKESLTGSVAVVKGDILKNKGTVSNPLQALQGQVPGVRITR